MKSVLKKHRKIRDLNAALSLPCLKRLRKPQRGTGEGQCRITLFFFLSFHEAGKISSGKLGCEKYSLKAKKQNFNYSCIRRIGKHKTKIYKFGCILRSRIFIEYGTKAELDMQLERQTRLCSCCNRRATRREVSSLRKTFQMYKNRT